MQDPKPQTAAGKVHWAFMMSLDGFVAGPGHTMDFMQQTTTRDGLLQEYIQATGAILAGRDGYDSPVSVHPYGGAWQGPIFVLTHHPQDAHPRPDVTFLNCPADEAVRIGLTAARGKNLQVHSPTIGRQLLADGLIDEIDIHIAPVLLGDGIRLYDVPGGHIQHLHRDGNNPTLAANLRYRPIRTNK
jgi:dihydrofolate reductase